MAENKEQEVTSSPKTVSANEYADTGVALTKKQRAEGYQVFLVPAQPDEGILNNISVKAKDMTEAVKLAKEQQGSSK